MSTLSGKELVKRYKQKTVVTDVSISMQKGEIVGLLGPNGAGKTTTFYMLTGIVKPSEGKVYLNEEEITSLPLYQRARQGLSYLPQESSVFKKLTVYENLQIMLEYTSLSAKEQEKKNYELLEEFGLRHLEKSYASYLSGGERRRLEIARCLIRDPEFVLLDEPFAGIDPIAVDDIQGIIKHLKEKNIGVLISDHNVRETLQICDRAYLMYQGKVILDGNPDEIKNNEMAKKVYLGDMFNE